jgi:RimJ/RimL family protein N-acetyltransferase
MGFSRLQGRRVALREQTVEETAAIEVWLDEAVAAAGFTETLPPPGVQFPAIVREGYAGPSRSGELVIERMGEMGPIGLIAYSVNRGWLAIPIIILAKPYRGWGYGSEAVRLLEQWAVHEGLAKRFRADIPVANGLALYFWLRLGYRPEGPEDDRGWRTEREPDRMRMVRYADDQTVKRR